MTAGFETWRLQRTEWSEYLRILREVTEEKEAGADILDEFILDIDIMAEYDFIVNIWDRTPTVGNGEILSSVPTWNKSSVNLVVR